MHQRMNAWMHARVLLCSSSLCDSLNSGVRHEHALRACSAAAGCASLRVRMGVERPHHALRATSLEEVGRARPSARCARTRRRHGRGREPVQLRTEGRAE